MKDFVISLLVSLGIWGAFTVAAQLLGCPGIVVIAVILSAIGMTIFYLRKGMALCGGLSLLTVVMIILSLIVTPSIKGLATIVLVSALTTTLYFIQTHRRKQQDEWV